METFVQPLVGYGNCTVRVYTQCQKNEFGTQLQTGQNDTFLCFSPNLQYCIHIKAGLENRSYSPDAEKRVYLWHFSPTTAVKISQRKSSAFTGALHMLLAGSIPATLLLSSLFRCVKASAMTGRFTLLSKYLYFVLICLCYSGVRKHRCMKHRLPEQVAITFYSAATPLWLFTCFSCLFLVCHLYLFLC